MNDLVSQRQGSVIIERVETGLGFEVVVDYAHNPDGVARALDAGRGGHDMSVEARS